MVNQVIKYQRETTVISQFDPQNYGPALSIKLRLIIPDLPDTYAPTLSDVLHQKLTECRQPWLNIWRVHLQDIKVLIRERPSKPED